MITVHIHNSKVFDLTSEELINKISTIQRWQNAFMLEENRITLNTNRDIENLIDLFDERFIRSEVTNVEYSTQAKIPAY